MTLRKLAHTAALLAFSSCMPAFASTLYTQTYDSSGSGYYSNNSTSSENPFTSYDNFSLTSDGIVNHVSWVGAYLDTVPATDVFTIAFFSDNGDAPATLLSSSSTTYFNTGDPYAVLDFDEDLPDFAAVANTTYWMEIQSSNENFLWLTSSNGDGVHYLSDNADTSIQGLESGDLAFTLSNNASTPEPSGLVLLGTGTLSLAGLAHRRFRRA